MTDEPSYQWLRVNESATEIVGTGERALASIFIMEGDRQNHITIRCKHTNKFWTWSPSGKDVPVLLQYEDETNICQKFDINTTFGEGLIRFNCLDHEKRLLKFVFGTFRAKLCTSDTRPGIIEEFDKCPASPCFETFLAFPKSTQSEPKFYLSLNHIVNSLRFEKEEDQMIRKDE